MTCLCTKTVLEGRGGFNNSVRIDVARPLSRIITTVGLLLLCVVITTTGADNSTDCPQLLYVAGNHDYPYVEGLYIKENVTYNGRPIYRHKCNALRLFFSNDVTSVWWVGPTVGEEVGYAVSYTDASIPTSHPDAWRYWRHKDQEWHEDPMARLICLDMSCIHLNVSGTYLPRECSGEYLLTDTISYDRPVYKHTGSGLYMYHGRWSIMCNVWAIGPYIGSDVALMYTYDGAINPLLITTNWTLTEKGMVTVDKTTNAREDTSVNIECLGSGDLPFKKKPLPLDDQACGRVVKTSPLQGPVSFLILGQTASHRGKWPWMAVILRANNATKCGAAVVSRRFLVTAAHCVDQKPEIIESYKVIVGAHDLDVSESGANVYTIKRIILHDNFTFSTLPFRVLHDIGLIEVDREMEYSDYIQPVCLPEDANVELPIRGSGGNFSECFITGFGESKIDAAGHSSGSGGKLQEQSVTLETMSRCTSRYFRYYRWLNTSDNLCVIPDRNAKICKGDSGGPMMCKRGSQWTLVGVASWSIVACIGGNIPSIYADVRLSTNWLRDQILSAPHVT